MKNEIDVIGLMNGTRKSHGFGEDRNRVVGGEGLAPALRATDYKEPIRVGLYALEIRTLLGKA